MRLARLHLARYGHLTGLDLAFAPRTPDLHLIVGDNEAGKSTTEAAITDLLYGFDHRTAFAFLHDAHDLEIGATLGPAGGEIAVTRRKRRAGSLTADDGSAVEEGVLARLLAGVDRATFAAQFSLDHARLQKGGQDMLNPDTDLGRLLFQAGAGLDWLGERLGALEAAAGTLFRPRGKQQAVNRALADHRAAIDQKKKSALSPRDYRAAQQALADVEAALAAVNRRLGEITQARTRLTRIRGVIPILRRIDAARAARADLGAVPDLPADLPARLEAAVAAQRTAALALAAARDERARADLAREAIAVDTVLLAREETLSAMLDTPLGRYRTAAEDLPRRRLKRDQQAALIAARGRDVGLPDLTAETAGPHLPTELRLTALRRLIKAHGERAQAQRLARTARDKALREAEEAGRRRDAMPEPPDPAPLAEAIAAAEAESGASVRLAAARDAAAATRDDIAKHLARLVPTLPDGCTRVSLPAGAAVIDYARSLAEIDDRAAGAAAEHDRLAADRLALEEDCQRLLAIGGAVPPERLDQARAWRDQGWQLVRRRFIDGDPSAETEMRRFAGSLPLPDAYAAAVTEADQVADARHDRAKVSGELAAKAAALAAVETRLAKLTDARQADAAASAGLRDRWQVAWADTGIDPLPPADMIDWLAALEAIEAARIDLARQDAAVAADQDRVTALTRRLAAALTEIGQAPDDGTTLLALLAAARATLDGVQATLRDRTAAADAARARSAAAAEAAEAHRAAEAEFDAWRQDWAAEMTAWSLPPQTDPADIDAVLAAWTAIVEAHKEIYRDDGLDHRIAAMQADRQRFVDDLERLAGEIAPDVAGQPVPATAEALKDRLAAARTARDRKADAVGAAEARAEQEAAAEAADRQAQTALAAILAELGVGDVAAAGTVLARVETAGRHGETIRERNEDLLSLGGGLDEADLRREAEGHDLDALAGEIARLDEEDKAVVAESQRLSAARSEAKAALEDVEQAGGATAVAAEAAGQAAAAAIDGAERYVRLTATAVLLRHAVERYRERNEGPLLTHASGLFERLTLGRYTGLTIDRDDRGQPSLRARTGDGGRSVPVDRLSDGARDQLYLALRLAGIALLLDRGTVLPLIADDLFVNFDDDRAAAGLAVLADLATRTQVLFFTHHRHLLALAQARLPGRFDAVTLAA